MDIQTSENSAIYPQLSLSLFFTLATLKRGRHEEKVKNFLTFFFTLCRISMKKQDDEGNEKVFVTFFRHKIRGNET